MAKLKKDGTRSFIVSSLPSAPSYTHLLQCSYYAAKYDFKVPVKLVYLTVKGHQTFSQDNCLDLTPDALRRHFNNMCNIFRRRELILSQFEDDDRNTIITKAAEVIDPNFDHPLLGTVCLKILWMKQETFGGLGNEYSSVERKIFKEFADQYRSEQRRKKKIKSVIQIYLNRISNRRCYMANKIIPDDLITTINDFKKSLMVKP